MRYKTRCIFFWVGVTSLALILVIPIALLQTWGYIDLQSPQPTTKTGRNVNKLTRNASIHEQSIVDFSSMMYFEPLVEEDFPTVRSEIPIIPHIIHQIHNDTNIPGQLVSYVKSLVANNPNGTYFFWTDDSAKQFIIERFPQLLPMWEDYRSPINRAHALRYLILYEYGGFYGDLDVECKRPLDEVTTKYSCIFPTEPFEFSVSMYQIPYLLTNAIMFCRPKHPFLKHLVDSLHQYQSMYGMLDVAGPSFVTSQFIRYNNITADGVYKFKLSSESNSPYFYKGNRAEDDVDSVYVPNTQYFMNSVDSSWLYKEVYIRFSLQFGRKWPIIVTKAYNEFERRYAQINRDKFAFTDRHWPHSYGHPERQLGKLVPLQDIVRKIKFY